MPRSRRRPATVRKKAAAARRRQLSSLVKDDPGGRVAEFTDAPWLTWELVRDNPDAPLHALEILEQTPFRMDWGDRIAPVSLAQIAGMVGIEIARLRWFADRGYLAWDPATRTVIATVPIDAR
jgi:hypothetical protein